MECRDVNSVRPGGATRRRPASLETLRHARLDHSHEAELRTRLAVDLLLIDDFGIEAMTAEESRDIYTLMTERHR
ncbi:MAG: hypothetical protein U0587_15390, partial [Candidatus Binatia bacterium]